MFQIRRICTASRPCGNAGYSAGGTRGARAPDKSLPDTLTAILAIENGWDDAQALEEARWQADRERCWRAFLRNAARVLQAPKAEREALLGRYRAEAERRYGEATGRDMAASMCSWVLARRVH